MRLTTASGDFKNVRSDSLVRFCKKQSFREDPTLREIDRVLGGTVRRIFESGEFAGELNETAVLHAPRGAAANRIVLAGLGEKGKITSDSYRQAAGTLSVLPAVKNSESVTFVFSDGETARDASATVEGLILARFKTDELKTADKKKNDRLKSVSFIAQTALQATRIKKAVSDGLIITDGVVLARRLAAQPANLLTPEKFAAEARSLARKFKLRINVLNERRIKAEKMGALLAVAQGSSKPPRFVVLEHRAGKSGAGPIVLVGKGITFDSGGISLKPVLDMHKMKGDMQAGAVVLATMVTAARLKLPGRVIGLIPLAENMPSSKALKPGDVVRSRKGKTVEIISTDAEGRLILADALDYADKFKPQAVIDMATLTGGALYVLGHAGVPVMGNDKRLINAIRAAAEATVEKVWELPLWEDYREQLESPVADLKNSGGKPANTITAAIFLEHFIGDWPWAHIDIAAVDDELKGRPYIPKGPSGIGLRLLVELLANWKKI
jgi:leucyl aminopeptidase